MTAPPTEAQNAAKRGKRVDSIDVARGLAVVLLFVNHGIEVLSKSTPEWCRTVLYRASDFCIPMFMGIAGLTMAYLLTRSGRDVRSVARRYVRRAVELLVGAHVAITIGTWPLYWSEYSFLDIFLRRWHITDAIAVCILAGPPLILALSDRARLIIAILIPIGCRAITAFWHPDAVALGAAKELLFGIDDYDPSPTLFNVYAIFPYLSMFLFGTLLATPVVNAIRDAQVPRLVRRLFVLSAALFATGAAAVGGYMLLRRQLDPQVHGDWLGFFFPSKITTLLPIYLAMATVLIALVIWRIEHQHRFAWLDFGLTVFGRTSLFAYISQYYLIQGAPAILGIVGAVPLWLFFPLMALFTLIMFVACYYYARLKQYVRTGDFQSIRERVTRPAAQAA